MAPQHRANAAGCQRKPAPGLTPAQSPCTMGAMRSIALVLMLFAAASDLTAQATGAASFRVYEKGALVGSVSMTLSPTDDGWRLQGSSRIAGEVAVDIPNLDLHYDRAWGGRFMTLE